MSPTVLYSTVQYCTVLSGAVQYCTVLHQLCRVLNSVPVPQYSEGSRLSSERYKSELETQREWASFPGSIVLSSTTEQCHCTVSQCQFTVYSVQHCIAVVCTRSSNGMQGNGVCILALQYFTVTLEQYQCDVSACTVSLSCVSVLCHCQCVSVLCHCTVSLYCVTVLCHCTATLTLALTLTPALNLTLVPFLVPSPVPLFIQDRWLVQKASRHAMRHSFKSNQGALSSLRESKEL